MKGQKNRCLIKTRLENNNLQPYI